MSEIKNNYKIGFVERTRGILKNEFSYFKTKDSLEKTLNYRIKTRENDFVEHIEDKFKINFNIIRWQI